MTAAFPNAVQSRAPERSRRPLAPLVSHCFRAALCALALALAGCAALQEAAPKPSARISGVRLAGLSLQKVDLVLDVELANPYAVALPLLDLTYALGSGGNRFLEGSVKPQQSIPARGTATVELPATVAFAPLLKTLQGVRPGTVLPYTVDLAATVDAPLLGRLVLPVSRQGELPIPAVPKIELTALRMESFSLDKVRAVLKVNVTNTNQFALDAGKLGLNLALGGKPVGGTGLQQPLRLEPGESAGVEMPLEFSPRTMGSAVLEVLRSSRAAFALSGTLEAQTPFGPLELPFKSSGSAPISR